MQGCQDTHLYYFSTSDKPSKALLQTNYTLCRLLFRKNTWGDGQGRQRARFTSSEFKSVSAKRPVLQISNWLCSSCSATKLAFYFPAATSKGKGAGGRVAEVLGRNCTTKGLVPELKNKRGGLENSCFTGLHKTGPFKGHVLYSLLLKMFKCTEVASTFSQLAESCSQRPTGHLAPQEWDFTAPPAAAPSQPPAVGSGVALHGQLPCRLRCQPCRRPTLQQELHALPTLPPVTCAEGSSLNRQHAAPLAFFF